jgi:hypothetical protein
MVVNIPPEFSYNLLEPLVGTSAIELGVRNIVSGLPDFL